MKRYWISWYSGGYSDEGCTEPPFKYWWTGSRARPKHGLTAEQYIQYTLLKTEDEQFAFLDKHERSTGTACAMVEAESKEEIWPVIKKYFPDYEYRFCEELESGSARPNDRFPGFDETRISLYEKT